MNHTVFRVMERNTCKVLFYRKKTNRTGQKNHHQRNPLSVQVPIARRPGCGIPKPTKHRIRVSRHSIDEKQKDIPSQKLKHEFIKSLSLPFQPPLTCFPAVSVLRSKNEADDLYRLPEWLDRDSSPENGTQFRIKLFP